MTPWIWGRPLRPPTGWVCKRCRNEKKHRAIAGIAALLALTCCAAWYSRPVYVLDLKPDREPVRIDIYIRQSGGTAEENKSLLLDVDTGDAEGQALLEQLKAIRIRRSPLNPIRQVPPPPPREDKQHPANTIMSSMYLALTAVGPPYNFFWISGNTICPVSCNIFPVWFPMVRCWGRRWRTIFVT